MDPTGHVPVLLAAPVVIPLAEVAVAAAWTAGTAAVAWAGYKIGTWLSSKEWEPGTKTDAKPKKGSAGGETAGKDFTPKQKTKARQEGEDTCVYCRGKGTETDHAIPKSKGGNTTSDNSQTACRHCNGSKGNGEFPKTPPKGYPGPWPPDWWQ